MKKLLKVEIIKDDVHKVLNFVNNNNLEVVSITSDQGVYKIFYYGKK